MRKSSGLYSVAVLECGSRFRDEDFAESTLRQPRRYFWAPRLGMRGVLRLTFFKDVFVMVDDPALKTARLSLMKRLEQVILSLADISEIVPQSE